MDEVDAINDERNPIVDREREAAQKGLLNPRGPYLRWIAVFFMCFLSFGKKPFVWEKNSDEPLFESALGSYYCYDNPAGLQDVMKTDLKITSSTFTSFYSWYSWPNVV